MPDESHFSIEDVAFTSVTNIVKLLSGKININIDNRKALSLNLERNKVFLDVQDPVTLFGMTDDENNDLGFFEKLKAAKRIGQILNDNDVTISILRKGKKAISLGRDATPGVSRLVTRSDDIQIDSVTQAAKLDRDTQKTKEEKD